MRVDATHSGVARGFETRDPTRRGGNRIERIALAIALTLLWFAWLGWLAMGVYVGVPEVEVPVLVGKTLADARGTAGWAGLRPIP